MYTEVVHTEKTQLTDGKGMKRRKKEDRAAPTMRYSS